MATVGIASFVLFHFSVSVLITCRLLSQVAMEAADMVLVRSDVCDVVSALHLGRKVCDRWPLLS